MRTFNSGFKKKMTSPLRFEFKLVAKKIYKQFPSPFSLGVLPCVFAYPVC